MDNPVRPSLEQFCSEIRGEIKKTGAAVKDRMQYTIATIPENDKADHREVMANLTLAYRHLEDAAMRMGKVIQANEGGVSIYDQNDARRVAGKVPDDQPAPPEGNVIN
jgi:hypothetical protein